MKAFRLNRIFVLSLLAIVVFSGIPASRTASAAFPDVSRARSAMVASQHELASKIGADIMRRGGNAVDAAIAVGFALAVVYPEAGNIGGGGFMMIRKANGETAAIDYREKAPAAAHRDIFIDKDGNLIRGEGSSTLGYRASGVPGVVAGFELAFKRHGSGKVKWSELVEPARLLAQDGFVLSYRLAELFKAYKNNLSKYPDSNRIFLNNGKYFEAGDRHVQTDLAATLGRIAERGADGFYTGRTAELIAADMRANNGLITLDDLKNYRAVERTPLKGNYRGYEIITMPPPSSGGIVMLQLLNVLEGFDVRGMGAGSAAKIHLYTEASRRAFADRAEFMADPDFAQVPTDALISKDYAKKRIENFSPTKTSPSNTVGHGTVSGSEPMETTHYTVVGPAGDVVSNTYTINDLYGSAVTAKGTGVLLNNEMDDFAARPGKPNLFGLIQGERNKVEPGKRPLSSMTPTIVLRKDGSLWFAVGGRGGPRIISAVMQIVINIIDHDMNIQEAIDAPRFHHQWFPDELFYERNGISPDTRKILESYGHKFVDRPGYIASATGIMVDERGTRMGAIDPRSDGAAIGY
ncbi:MAG: gamma-glutamyltransferase [Blastocatellia bacterium]|nr:gamma-glutamyltransferase [Chloracidobacterium sp.]MBL8184909.1 gamma-glutamyltransferase [Blastocatellia bacterium]HRJ88973.1 gamma-glutamyltransferase [Pyrinomonadaceae bacterium]HRK51559.1 gamma-glutamyltransferase [Pyrinomonadaceae bacterium]